MTKTNNLYFQAATQKITTTIPKNNGTKRPKPALMSGMPSATKAHSHRKASGRKAGKFLVLVLFVGLVLAAVVGMLVVINNNALVQSP